MTLVDALRCRDFVELATGYLENALPLPERARVELHLALCPACPIYLAQLRQTIRWLGQLAAEPPAPRTRHELHGLFHAWQHGAL
jgi:anti-sigma factor RsiW